MIALIQMSVSNLLWKHGRVKQRKKIKVLVGIIDLENDGFIGTMTSQISNWRSQALL